MEKLQQNHGLVMLLNQIQLKLQEVLHSVLIQDQMETLH